MYKGLIAEIAKEVGKSAALILNQIYQWFKSKKVDKVYRTNEELKADLCDLISTATIQRAKQKLIEKGYIIVSFDKGVNRTTHFTLTDKAKKLLASNNEVKTSPTVKQASPVNNGKPKTNNYNPAQSKVVDNRSESMVKAFDEYGTHNPDVKKGVPDVLKKLFGIKGNKKEEVKDSGGSKPLPPLPTVEANEDFFGEPAFNEVIEDEDMSDEEYFGVTPAQWMEIDIANEQQMQNKDSTFSVNDLVGMAFGKVPNVDIREKNREMLTASHNFKEDY